MSGSNGIEWRIGASFVASYYKQMTSDVVGIDKFYGKESQFTIKEMGDTCDGVEVVVGAENIRTKLVEANLQAVRVQIKSIVCQGTVAEGILCVVVGEISSSGSPSRRFSQTFQLAKHAANKYYLRNDCLCYTETVAEVRAADASGAQQHAVGRTVGEVVQQQQVLQKAAPPPSPPQHPQQAQTPVKSQPEQAGQEEEDAWGVVEEPTEDNEDAWGDYDDNSPQPEQAPAEDAWGGEVEPSATVDTSPWGRVDNTARPNTTPSQPSEPTQPTTMAELLRAKTRAQQRGAIGPQKVIGGTVATHRQPQREQQPEPRGRGRGRGGGAAGGGGSFSAATGSAGTGGGGGSASIHKVFIRPVEDDCTNGDVKAMAQPYGTVTKVDLLHAKHIGFIEFQEADAVDRIIAASSQGLQLKDRPLTVEAAKQNPNQGGGGGGGGGGSAPVVGANFKQDSSNRDSSKSHNRGGRGGRGEGRGGGKARHQTSANGWTKA